MKGPHTKPSIVATLLKTGLLLGSVHWLKTTILEEPMIMLLAMILRLIVALVLLSGISAVLTLAFDIFKHFRSWKRLMLKGMSAWLSEPAARKARLHRRRRDVFAVCSSSSMTPLCAALPRLSSPPSALD